MAWTIKNVDNLMGNADNSSNSLSINWFEFFEDMITAGWRVMGSGDGISFENDGQVVTNLGTGSGGVKHVITQGITPVYNTAAAGNMGNANSGSGSSWLRIKTPADAAVQREFIWSMNYFSSTQLYKFRIEMSQAGFVGNDATVWQAPTATDHITLSGTQTRAGAAADYRSFGPATGETGNRVSWVIGDVSEEYSFFFHTTRKSTTHQCMGFFAMDQCVSTFPGTNPPTTADPDPHYFIMCHQSGTSPTTFFRSATAGVASSNNGADDMRLEDAATTTPSSGCVSSAYLGESPVPAQAGHYKLALTTPFDTGGSITLLLEDELTGLPISANISALMRYHAGSNKMYKGIPRGRLIQMITRGTTNPVVLDFGTERRLQVGFWTIPWHETDGFTI